MKKAIAMKCTQEDWDSIKDRIPKDLINDNQFDLIEYPYLTNNYYSECKKGIGTHSKCYIKGGVEIHETFNAKIFLDACGIETTPTLEEVKEYFKDAEIVKSIYGKQGKPTGNFHFEHDCYFCEAEKDTYLALWKERYVYAKILTYKTPKFEITNEQVLSLHRHGHDLTKTQLEDIFPEVFKNELAVGVWQKVKGRNIIFCLFENGIYGFLNGVEKTLNWDFASNESLEEVTPQEVKDALIGEAKKRGFESTVSFKPVDYENTVTRSAFEFGFDLKNNKILFGNYCIFDNGIWATITETITIQESEKLLKEQGINKKIV